jgi:ribokinase
MQKSTIVVLGSSNTDMVIRLDRIPRPGETKLGGHFFMAAGGKGANQAVASARSGGRVTFIARVGADLFGDRALTGFREDGINVRYIVRDRKANSGVALIFVAANGENSIAVAGGANGRLSPQDVGAAASAIRRSRVVLAQLETPIKTIGAAARATAKAGGMFILNPAPACALPGSLLKLVSILTPNQTEAQLLTGVKVTDRATATKAAARLHVRGVSTVIITLGALGALISSSAGVDLVPGFKVNAIDATGAGDVFNGALATALCEGQPLAAAVRYANAAAAISVTRLGAQPSAPTRIEIQQLLRARNKRGNGSAGS